MGGYCSRQKTSACNLKDLFCVDSPIQSRILEKLGVLEVERGSALEVEKGSTLGAGSGEGRGWSEDLLTCCEFRQLKLVSRIVK